jgi:hypothetical protein
LVDDGEPLAEDGSEHILATLEVHPAA